MLLKTLFFPVFYESGDVLFIQYKLVIITVLPAGPSDLSPESISDIVFGERDQGDAVDPLSSKRVHAVAHHPASDALPAEFLCDAYMVETSLPAIAPAQDRTDYLLAADRDHTCRGIPL